MQISITNEMARAGLLRTFSSQDNDTIQTSSDITSEKTFYYNLVSNTLRTDSTWGPKLSLMKGTVPTDFSALSNYVTRWTADRLVTWSTGNLGTAYEDPNNPLIYFGGTQTVNATASGTATWLWWFNFDSGSSDIWCQAIFTVGSLGSGSDFEMPDTNIVAGRPYRLANGPRIAVATTFNY